MSDEIKNLNNETAAQTAPKATDATAAPAKPAATAVSKTSAEPKKGKYADVMNIRLSEGRRDEIKKFCTNCGASVSEQTKFCPECGIKL